MSSNIWTLCGGDSEIRLLTVDAWRSVEAQHQVATRKLVESDAEQLLLEDLIETVKPPLLERTRLHYLLSTPFRYPPLRYGSRFGTRQERGIWYGSEMQATLFAEVAYYRFLFLHGSSAELGVVETELTAFRAAIRSERGIDLTRPPFDAHVSVLASPTSYDATQALGRAMRDAGVETFRYTSARDAAGGMNVGVFAPAVFGRRQPRSLETWHCTATRSRVEVTRRDYFRHTVYGFTLEQFLVEGRLPAPAL